MFNIIENEALEPEKLLKDTALPYNLNYHKVRPLRRNIIFYLSVFVSSSSISSSNSSCVFGPFAFLYLPLSFYRSSLSFFSFPLFISLVMLDQDININFIKSYPTALE